MTRTPLIFLAWLALAAIVFVTISPIGLRPRDVAPVDFDRAAAFALTAFLFVIAYPRHWMICAVLIVFSAFGIEALQYLSPSRHAHLHDALVKSAGAVVGSLIGWVSNTVISSFFSRTRSYQA
ncbi:VanZ family protein [Oryzifoliimicrobium ureilyticus]|uniref:VanZ family protein n=1 Tax=Oryzifoliimicrobium ureilyticus TaxID=3113724 RepID=UPI00307637A5